MKTLVLGYGKTGRALTEYIIKNNVFPEGIAVYDDNLKEKDINIPGVQFFTGRNDVHEISLCLASPGIDREHKILSKLRSVNIPVISEIEFAYNQLVSKEKGKTKPKILAITGTNGKTTTTAICKDAIIKSGLGEEVFVGGNFGTPFISGAGLFNGFILEISSFQLEWIYNFKPDISVLLNVEDDHLDRYENFDEYRLTKYKLFKNMDYGDVSILNYEDYNSRILKGVMGTRSILFGFDENRCDAFYKDGFIHLKFKDIAGYDLEISLEKLKDKKRYIIEDMLAAASSLCLFGISPEHITSAFNEFEPLSHRIEYIGSIGNIEFYDDSKATNPAAVISALKTLMDDGRHLRVTVKKDIVLILGGKDKGFSYESLIEPVASNVRACVLMGETKNILMETLKGHIELIPVNDMDEAVKESYLFLKNNYPGGSGAVLLSPASSSFDMFKDYNDRGAVFCRSFKALKARQDALI